MSQSDVKKVEQLTPKLKRNNRYAVIGNLVSFTALLIIFVSTLGTQRLVDYWTDYGSVVVIRLTITISTSLLPFPFLTGVEHLLAYFNVDGYYNAVLYDGVNRIRWISYSITNGLVTISLLTLVGAGNIYLVVSSVLANAVMMYFGYKHEVANHPARSKKTLEYLLMGFVPFFALWIPILGYQISRQSVSKLYESFAVYGSFPIALLFVVPLLIRYRSAGSIKPRITANYRMENFYILLSLTAKIYLDWAITFGNLVDP
jgi:hypothetical protein